VGMRAHDNPDVQYHNPIVRQGCHVYATSGRLTLQKSSAVRSASAALRTSLSAAVICSVAESNRISYSCARPPWFTSLGRT